MIEGNIRVVKEASCPSLSGRSTLKYQLGSSPSGNHIRISSNSGTGSFSGEWFPLEDILKILGSFQGPFNWEALRPLVKGKSLNTAGFLMGALLDAGLIKPSEQKAHRYEAADPKEFMAEVESLKKPAPTKGKRKALEKPSAEPA